MSAPIYFHIGKPKCGSTFLQKELFPYGRHKYIGKSHKYDYLGGDGKARDKGDLLNYNLIKKILSKGPAIARKEDFVKCSSLYQEESLLLSEELITCRIIYKKIFRLISLFGKQPYGISKSKLIEESFKLGLNYQLSADDKAIFDVANIINNLSSLFARDPGGILLIERDYADWIVSLFTTMNQQNINLETKSRAHISRQLFNEDALLGLAGFSLGLEKSAYEEGLSYGISTVNTKHRLNSVYPSCQVTILSHLKDKNEFNKELTKIPENFQVSTAVKKLFERKTKRVNSSNEQSQLAFNIESTKEIIKNQLEGRNLIIK